MKRWTVITLMRMAALLLIAGFIYGLIIYKPEHDAKKIIKENLEIYSVDLGAVNNLGQLITSVPDISRIGTQQIGNYSSFRDELKNRLIKVRQSKIAKPENKKVRSLVYKQVVTGVNEAIAAETKIDLEPLKNDAAKLMKYHNQVMAALVNTLEYNPADDTKRFSLGSDDTNHRLQLAEAGLQKTKTDLQKLNGIYNDKTLDEITSMVAEMQNSRNDLSKTGNTKTWAASVSAIQKRIINNRKEFWNEAADHLIGDLEKNKPAIERNFILWQNLQTKYY